jgi:hypothetical protein
VLQAAAFKVILELALHECRQRSSLSDELLQQSRVKGGNDLIQQVLFGWVPFVVGALGAELERVLSTESLLYQLPGGLFSIVTNTLYGSGRKPHFRLDPSGRCGAASSTTRCSPRNQTH